MFTGLVEKIGTIKRIQTERNLKKLYIEVDAVFIKNINTGNSIAIDGLCLTVEKIENNILQFSALNSSIDMSIIKYYKLNSKVNLERAMSMNDRLEGHIVSGHVDTIGKITKFIKTSNKYTLYIELSSKFGKYLIENDSISVNGISLTIKNVYDNTFTLDIIPETIIKTNLQFFNISDYLNIEINSITKSIYKFSKRGF